MFDMYLKLSYAIYVKFRSNHLEYELYTKINRSLSCIIYDKLYKTLTLKINYFFTYHRDQIHNSPELPSTRQDCSAHPPFPIISKVYPIQPSSASFMQSKPPFELPIVYRLSLFLCPWSPATTFECSPGGALVIPQSTCDDSHHKSHRSDTTRRVRKNANDAFGGSPMDLMGDQQHKQSSQRTSQEHDTNESAHIHTHHDGLMCNPPNSIQRYGNARLLCNCLYMWLDSPH